MRRGELQHLLSIDMDFDITVTGFEVPEIDLLLQAGKAHSTEIEAVNAADLGPAVSGVGDLWHLGRHRILCGNALLDSSFKALFEGKKADMVLADPPYGVKIDGHATGNGATHHREFAMGCGALHPERDSVQALLRVKQEIGEFFFSSQYQQNPRPLDGGIIKKGWIKYFELKDIQRRFDLKIQSWDTANKVGELNDYSVCTTWGMYYNSIYLLDLFRMRLNYPDL